MSSSSVAASPACRPRCILREAGVDVAIVEAAEPGWGASGRNNGQVIPTLSRHDPEDIVARHGAAGERVCRFFLGRGPGMVAFSAGWSDAAGPPTPRLGLGA